MPEDILPFILATKQWIQKIVIGLNLCPFASYPYEQDKISYAVCLDTKELLYHIHDQIELILSEQQVETSFIIIPDLTQFLEYLDIVDSIEHLLKNKNLEGIVQIASFHPDYQFQDLSIEDVRNLTNRSPYPMIHILREESVSRAVAAYQDIDTIPIKNQKLLLDMGWHGYEKYIAS